MFLYTVVRFFLLMVHNIPKTCIACGVINCN